MLLFRTWDKLEDYKPGPTPEPEPEPEPDEDQDAAAKQATLGLQGIRALDSDVLRREEQANYHQPLATNH